MLTKLYLTPRYHGREMDVEEYDALTKSDVEPGSKYELVDGRLDVSPEAGFPHHFSLRRVYHDLYDYSLLRPEVINFVCFASRVFVPDRPTRVEPDVCAYQDFPIDLPPEEVAWPDVLPILVVEVLSPDTAAKDLERNRDLYLQVSSIREYWIVDTRESFSFPSLIVLRKRGRRWVERIVHPGETYEPALLPGFTLPMPAPAG